MTVIRIASIVAGAWLASASMLLAQIDIREVKQAYWSMPGAQVIDGQIVAPVGSLPRLDRVEVSIHVESVVEYRHGQLKARRLPSFERVSLDEVGKGVYRFKPSAPEGQYLLEYTAYDPEKGIASDDATITLERSSPQPEPIDPVTPDGLSQVAKESREAARQLLLGMASDMDKAAEAVEAKRANTVIELSQLTMPWDVETRNKFKSAMAAVLMPGLGRESLPVTTPKTLREVADGFRRSVR